MKSVVAALLASVGALAGTSASATPNPTPIVEDKAGSGRITNFAALDRVQDDAAPRLGIRLAESSQADKKKTSTAPDKNAIYGHNVADVVIGKTHAKGPTTGTSPQAKPNAIYNGTITSEPTNTLVKPPKTGSKTPATDVSASGQPK